MRSGRDDEGIVLPAHRARVGRFDTGPESASVGRVRRRLVLLVAVLSLTADVVASRADDGRSGTPVRPPLVHSRITGLRTPNRRAAVTPTNTARTVTSPEGEIVRAAAPPPASGPPALPLPAPASDRIGEPFDTRARADVLSGPRAHSLAELETLALQNNPTIRAAEALVVQQQGLLRQLTRYPNPSAGWVQSTPSRRSEGATAGAFLSQDIVTAGKLRVAGAAERVEIEWRCIQLKAQIDRVVNDVRIRYYETLGAQQAVHTAVELERLAAEDVKVLSQLLTAKQASRPDVLQAEIHLSAVRASLQDARLRHEAAWRQLANLVGDPKLPLATLPNEGENDVPQLDWEGSWQRLLAESPLLRAQAAQVREAEIEVELQKRLVIPNLNVQTVIQRDYVRNFNEVSTLLSAQLPLFNRNQGNILNAEGTLRLQQQEYQRLQLALGDQLASSFQQYASARNQVDHLREILPLTEENIRLTTQAFRTGQAGFDFMRVRDAEQLYYQTRTSYIDALTAVRKVAIEIAGLQLTGGLNPTEIGTALQATPGVPSGLGGVLLQFSQQEAGGVGRTLPGALQSTVAGPQ